MRACLADAGLAPEDVDYVNAHGTGTKYNDVIETQAIRRVFGKHADRLSVSSTKSMHAHCMGASGALELIACVMAIREGIVPPTANYREKDPECDLDVTPNVARKRNVRAAISNAFAFGGTNAVVAVKAEPDAASPTSCGTARDFSRPVLMRAGRAPKCCSDPATTVDPAEHSQGVRWPTFPPSRSPRAGRPANPDIIQLYSFPTPNGVKVSIALEELGLPYEAACGRHH